MFSSGEDKSELLSDSFVWGGSETDDISLTDCHRVLKDSLYVKLTIGSV